MTHLSYRIKSKKKLVLTIITSIITLLTIWLNVAIFTAISQYVLAGISTLLLLIVIGINIHEIFKIKVYKLTEEENIAKYMSKLYDSTGEFIISSTGSMKWVSHHGIKAKLLKKAQEGHLTIFIPKENIYTNEFKKAGAKIIDYEHSEFKPTSNFSIIRPGSPDAMIAIGRPFNMDEHIIEEYMGSDTIMLVVNDVQKLLKKLSENHGD
ncbi:hypothetical protein FACS1894142_0570 [Spirochaetia bacterium]|nr:hypothetical protein FACS1894142_0570 [Spirochaetia bacterium]